MSKKAPTKKLKKSPMFSKLNKHFFPDKEDVAQAYLYHSGDVTIDQCGELVEEIVMHNAPHFIEDEDGNLEPCEKPDVINLLITSSGGDMVAAFALINAMQGSEVPIRTIVMGEASSAALCILMAGDQRVITPYASLLSHVFNSGTEGSYYSMKNMMSELDEYHKKMVGFYMEHTGLSQEVIDKHLLGDSDKWLSIDEALKYNIADVLLDLS